MDEIHGESRGEAAIEQAGETFQRHLHLLAYAACQFKPTFKEHVDVVLRKYCEETGIVLNSHIPLGCGHNDDAYDNVWQVEDIDDFPDIVASMGFGDFFRKAFVERFVKKGYFASAWTGKINDPFERAGFRDPDGWYTIYSVFPYVMLVDRRRLGSHPVPRSWPDLLHPDLRDRIIINGSEGLVAEVPLLYFFREHGEDGLIRLAANIRDSWHPAQMARAAASNSSKGAAVYIIPWFWSQVRDGSDDVQLVWPEDGALTSPIYLLIKASKRDELSSIVACLTSTELGAKSAQACFPSLNPLVDNKLPERASFKWLGWDYIKSHDLEELRNYTNDVFLNAWRAKKGV
jgi:ABC-type Fe3+ transport system substrate-binding protein